MNMNQFTQKSIEALRDTQSIALENGNQQIEQIHLLDALVSKDEGLIPNLIKQSGASIENIKTLTDQAISSLPKVSDNAKQFIIDSAYDPTYGARPLKRFIQSKIETLLARAIIGGNVESETTLEIDCENSALVIK